MITVPRRPLLLIVVVLLAVAGAAVGAADDGWTIESFHAAITVESDGALLIEEAIDVDFGALERHGILRGVPVRYDYRDRSERVYGFSVERVTDAAGQPWPYARARNGANEQLRIGDPDRTVTGRQTYRITYRVRDALNGFPTHDELYWNVNGGQWPVPARRVSATVSLAGGGLERAACFQGAAGATEACAVVETPDRIEYVATRPLAAGEQLTLVAAIQKGLLPEPRVALEGKPREFLDYFERTAAPLGAAVAVFAVGLLALGRAWWVTGRDRRYTTLHYLTEDPTEETLPLFRGDTVVVEFEPPENLRPAQVGLLLDERADTKDATATIVDLAVRGYLTIAEVPKRGIFGRKDWTLTRRRMDTDGLEPYEATLIAGLFDEGTAVALSDLKNEFYKTLGQAQKDLYADAVRRGWFNRNPATVRLVWQVAGLVIAGAGAGLVVLLGSRFGWGVVGVSVALIGLLVLATASRMPRRTARGRELLRRALGFRRYIATAETDRQRFNEQAGIFAAYLPYAIVFGCVERWASAFRDIGTTAATAGWYAGTSGLNASRFSRELESFSSQVSGAITSTPGSSGRSGFSGGSAGGGGGGGGGGSW